MINLKKLGFLFLSVFISVDAFAARDFFIRNAEVVSVAAFYDGTNNVVQVKFRASPADVDAGSLNCPPTWEQGETSASDIKVLSWWSSSKAPNSLVQMYYSSALAAKAQNRAVDLSVKTNDCSHGSKNYGHKWSGIRDSE